MSLRAVSRSLPILAWVAQPVAAYLKIGEYMPVSNVLEHAQITLDVGLFMDALVGESPNYTKASHIYENGGGNSCKSSTKRRKLHDFATKDMAGETFHDAFRAAGFKVGFWDTWMHDALEGKGTFKDLSRVKRVTSLKKGVLGLVTYYASHELESAIDKAREVDTRSDAGSGHAWDEGWAFYYGAAAWGKYSPWEVAKKRDEDFPDGLQVCHGIVPHFNQGLIAVRNETYSSETADQCRDTIYKFWAVTYLRAALKYLQLAESNYDEKAHAEGYAYYMAIDGWVHSKNAAAANKMRSALAIHHTAIPNGTYCDAKHAMEAAYDQLGINCTMVGSYKAEAIDCNSTCTDAAVSLPAGANHVATVEGKATNIDCPLKDNTDDKKTPNENDASGGYRQSAGCGVLLIMAFFTLLQ